MLKVINRKNYVIQHSLNTSKEWNEIIKLEFQPDEMIVKQITYCSAADPTAKQGGVFLLYWLENRDCFGSFYDGCSIAPNHTFLAKNWNLSSNMTMRVIDAGTNQLPLAADGELVVHLEFVKYQY